MLCGLLLVTGEAMLYAYTKLTLGPVCDVCMSLAMQITVFPMEACTTYNVEQSGLG